jgi:sigma-B regulation protein RsbU (phosphoserine phosphatase)
MNLNDAMPQTPVENSLLHDLRLFNRIAQTLNQATDVRRVLNDALAQLVELLGLETGWIFVRDPGTGGHWAGRGFVLAAHYQLPPALALDRADAWGKSCSCQNLCRKGQLDAAYNEVQCSRLAEATGDRNGLAVHASVPLATGERIMGILNVAAPSWDAFDERALGLLSTVGSQMGIALERAQLHDALRERRFREQEALLTLSQKLLGQSSSVGLEGFIVEEVRRLLDASACALLLPDDEDEEQLLFRAAAGWHDDPVAAQRRIPTNKQSRVGRVFLSQRPLTAAVNIQTPVSPMEKWAAGEGFQAIAAVPLVVEADSVGVMAVHSREEREFDADDLRFLQLMANQAAMALEARRLQHEELQLLRVERELSVGREIQRSLLPVRRPVIEGWQLAASYQAAREVGGDFYDFFPVTEDKRQWNLIIADVADKGVPSALYMVLSRTAIRNASDPDRLPADTLQLANRYMLADTQADILVSALCGRLFADNGRFVYSNAGHNYPLWWQAANCEVVELTDHGLIMGVRPNLGLTDYEVRLEPGDALVMYTDGVTESLNPAHEEYGVERFVGMLTDSLRANPNAGAETIAETILNSVADFVDGAAQADDITLLVIKRDVDGEHKAVPA